MTDEKKKILVFDIPTRLFHWLFAFGFIGAFSIGNFVDDESALYPLHMLFGALMTIAIMMRIIWGLFGSKYARFSSFKLNPMGLIEYFKNIFNGTKTPSIGRNPASSFAAVFMMLASIGMALTGWFMINATSENAAHDIKEIHETLAIVFLLIALAHIAGIVIHTITKKDPIGLSMINGNKISDDETLGIKKPYALIGALFLALIGASAFAFTNNYDANNRSVNVFGKNLILGENEENEGGAGEEGEENEENEEEEHKAKPLNQTTMTQPQINGINMVAKPQNSINPKKSEESEEENEKHEKGKDKD